MTDFNFYMPTRVFRGRDCVKNYGSELIPLGSHALVVTGKSSAKNGALFDVLSALAKNGQAYTVYDRVTPNPTIACVREGVALLKSAGADFIVAIGGGSPMDAAKAIAVLSVQEREDSEIFAGGYEPVALPMAHVPTTAGTGSEVTQYSVLTNDERQTKTSISSPALFPHIAFLDGKYTQTLSRRITVNTAADAFSHAIEGILSTASSEISDMFARESLRFLYPLLRVAAEDSLSQEDRDTLLYASSLAGMTIAQTGTTAVHGMGYYLTYFHAIDHGRANALLLGETLRLCERKRLPQTDMIVRACGCNHPEEVCETLDLLVGKREEIPRGHLMEYARRAVNGKNILKSRYLPTGKELEEIYLKSFPFSD